MSQFFPWKSLSADTSPTPTPPASRFPRPSNPASVATVAASPAIATAEAHPSSSPYASASASPEPYSKPSNHFAGSPFTARLAAALSLHSDSAYSSQRQSIVAPAMPPADLTTGATARLSVSSSSSGAAPNAHSLADLIPVMNRLQDVFMSTTMSQQDSLDLPQIVVIGSQSSGKSSVIENIVQRDFLPRGKDIVTRRPLVLQLVHKPAPTGEDASPKTPLEYAEFLHIPEKTFTDFNDVRKEIERETERMAGQNKGISRSPIHLRIYSPNVLNLTLVDLPGITKIAVGDQPPDIEVRIRKLLLEYVSKPNAIILAVSPANQDIVNSEALKMAREVDPEGKRTLGVLTKLDLMDAGTNAVDVLTGRNLPLKLGFIGVVNRSQQDINDHKNIKQALKQEEEFFKNHPAYRSISSRCGTNYLAKTLNGILMHHIRERLPELKSRLNLLIVQTEQELASYGDPIFTGKNHQGSLVLRLLTRFCTNFNSAIDGTYAGISTTELCGGARLYYIFNSIFGQTLESIDPCEGLTAQDIRTAIRNSTGPRPSLFIPEVAFDLLIKPQIKKLEVPCLRCVELVFDEMLKIVNACETKELIRFPRLHQKVLEVVVEMLRERMAPTQAYLESLVAIQLAYINTNHPDFIGGSAAIAMLERKHDKRRREIEKHRKQQLAAQHQQLQQISANANGMAGKEAKHTSVHHQPSSSSSHSKKEDASESSPEIISHKMVASSKSESHITLPGHHLPHGRDGGFLTYFFGGHQASHDLPSSGFSRSSSPSRMEPSEQAGDMVSVRSSVEGPTHSHQQTLTHEKEEIEVELIRSLIQSYFKITRKTIADLIPKTIMHLIVNYARENIQNRLVSSLYREELFSELLMEDAEIMSERGKCKALLDTYRRGATVLQDIF